ncbi:MAG: hypothetical protein AB7F40_04555 [Victivallaceae bacterium]
MNSFYPARTIDVQAAADLQRDRITEEMYGEEPEYCDEEYFVDPCDDYEPEYAEEICVFDLC